MPKIISIFAKHSFLILFLLIYFSISFFTYKDFGITDDEALERNAASDLLSYISKPTTTNSITDEDYNDTVFEKGGHHPLISKYQRYYQLLQRVLNPKGYYEWDHLINLAFGSLFFVFTYIIFYIQFKSTLKSMIGVTFLALTPRLIGHIPINNKDVPFALFYLASLIVILITSKYKMNSCLKIIILGLIFGITQTNRAVGFSIYIVYILYFIFTATQNKTLSKQNLVNFALELISIGLISISVSIAFFPWLGSNLITNIKELLLNSQNYHEWDNLILFNGKFITKDQRPWYYLFTWIFITTPVFMLGLLGFGVTRIKSFLKNPLSLIMIIALFVNISLYLIIQPVVYNGLRHFLFLIPPLVLFSACSFIDLLNRLKGKLKVTLIFLVMFNSSLIISSYIQLHPYEYIYFNELIGELKGAQGKYDTDYWGLTYKEATEWILNQPDTKENTYVLACDQYFSVQYFSKEQFKMLSGSAKPLYGTCETDTQSKREFMLIQERPGGTIIYEIKRMGVILNKIKKYDPNLYF